MHMCMCVCAYVCFPDLFNNSMPLVMYPLQPTCMIVKKQDGHSGGLVGASIGRNTIF